MKRALAFAAVLLATAAAPGQAAEHSPVAQHWVATWTSMPQLTEPANLPPAPFIKDGKVLPDTTLRQTLRVSVGGPSIRLRFSNAFGGSALPITSVSIALPADGRAGVSAIQPGTAKPITFHGKASTVIPVGAQVLSDPLPFAVSPLTNLTVTTYLATGQESMNVTSHPGSRTTSHLLAGNHVTDTDLPGATPVDHWYFLSGAEVTSTAGTSAVAMLGDSLTDGRGSTTNGNDRWPDQLASRNRARQAVLNQAAGGNRVLRDGLGPNALARLDRDILAQTGIAWLIVFEGVNDIGGTPANAASQAQISAELIDGYHQIIDRAHARGLRVYGATVTPFGGNGYDDPDGLREAARQSVNTWIRTSGEFDAVLDFDRVARDPAATNRLLPAYDVGDHLHFSPAGYRALADSVPGTLFTRP